MRATLLGVRGSTPSPGLPFVRYGGHTSCVALTADRSDQPGLVLDAGTGIRDLDALAPRPFAGTVVLTHLHWDHVHGLPFSGPLLQPDARVEVVVPVEDGDDPVTVLLPNFSPPAFPVRPDDLGAGWTYSPASERMERDGWLIRTAVVRHKGGRTIGIRVERDGRSLVYLPDHDLAEPDPAALELAAGADVLLHDAQYLASEIGAYRHFGHSTVERACAFADAAQVERLVLTHHAPARTDDELDEIAARWPTTSGGIPVVVGRAGDVLQP